MWQRVALSPFASLLVLLAPLDASAQFNLGSLKSFSPGKIVGTLKDSRPDKTIEHALSEKSPKTLVSEALADKASTDLAMKLQQTSHDTSGQAIRNTEQAAKALTESGPQQVAQVLRGSEAIMPVVPTGAPDEVSSPTSTTQTTTIAVTDPKMDAVNHKDEVFDALQAVGDTLQKTGEALGNTTVEEVWNNTDTKEFAEAFKQAVPKNLDDALVPSNLKKAHEGLEKAGQTLRSRHPEVADALKIKLPSREHVEEAIESTSPEVAHIIKNSGSGVKWMRNAIQQNRAGVEQAIKDTSPKIAHEIENTNTKQVEASPEKIGAVEQTVDRLEDRWGSNWQWLLLSLVVVAGGLLVGWQIFERVKPRETRAPTLLADREMNMWMGTGQHPQRSPQPGSEELLFTQF